MATLPVVTIDQITDANWQMSNKDFGQVAQGTDDILMCIHNILFTMVGEVPFSPFFGSILYKLIDMPVNIVAPLIVSEIISAIGKFEPRVAVTAVVPTLAADASNITFDVSMVVISTSAPLGYIFTLDNSKNNRRSFSDGFDTTYFV